MFVKFKKPFQSFVEGDVINTYDIEAKQLIGMNIAESLGLNPFSQNENSNNNEKK